MASSTWIGRTGTWQSSGTNWSPPLLPTALTDVTLDDSAPNPPAYVVTVSTGTPALAASVTVSDNATIGLDILGNLDVGNVGGTGSGGLGYGQFSYNNVGTLSIESGGLLDLFANATIQGSGGTNATVIIAGTLTTDDNKNSGDTGSTSTWSDADVLLSGGTINLGTSSGDGRSHLIVDNASTLTVTGNGTINGPDVTSTGYGVTTHGVDNQGTTVVTGTLSLNTVYAIDNNGANGAFINDGAVNVTGSGDVVVVSQQNDAITGTGTFFVTDGGNFDDTKDVGVITSPIAGANIVVGTGGSFDISGGFKNGPTFSPNSLFETGSWTDVLVGGARTGDTATYNALTDTITVDQAGFDVVIQNVTLDGESSGLLRVTVNGNNDYITACFAPGTRIMTAHGEVPIEDLRVGEEVETVLGGGVRPIRWIGRRSYAAAFAAGNRKVMPVRISAGAIADGVPTRDLLVSPLHAFLLDGILVPAEQLVNGRSVVQLEAVSEVRYIHIELDGHDIILAEGTPTETFVDDGNRRMFHNAHEYWELYPNAQPQPAIYCAPRLEHGPQVDAIWQRLAARCGVYVADGAGGLRGFVDRVDDRCVRRWAQNERQPEHPVCVDVVLDGVVITQGLANAFRPDLETAGIGKGRHAFVIDLPVTLDDEARGRVLVRRSADGQPLPQHARFQARYAQAA